MNKIVQLILIILLVVSCASNQFQSIDSEKNDLLSNESLLRYSSDRKNTLEKKKGFNLIEVMKCHNGEIEEGLKLLKQKYAPGKNNSEYWNHVGVCHYLGGNYPKAIFYYNLSLQTCRKNEQYPAAYNNLGVIYLKLRHFEKSHEFFKLAIKSRKKLFTPLLNISHLYIKFGMINKALKELNKLHYRNNQDVDVLASLGTAWLLKGNSLKSITFFNKISEKNRTRQDIAAHFALALYVSKNYEGAINALSEQKDSGISEIKKMSEKLEGLIKAEIKREKEEKKKKKKKRG